MVKGQSWKDLRSNAIWFDSNSFRVKNLKWIAPLIIIVGLMFPTTAYANECHIGGLLCGSIKHYAPDAGYNKPILVRCQWGVASSQRLVYEGYRSTCKDTDEVGVRPGEEIWCKYSDRDGNKFWHKAFDATGWHKINDIWDDGYGCTTRRD